MQKRRKGQKISTTNFDIEIGLVLHNERKRQGKNQEDIAKYLGVGVQQYQKYERGTNKISPIMLSKLGYFLGKSGSELFGEAEKQYYKNQIN
jgi:transcriptional regulator with XRE-family HTH domain